MVEEAAPDFSEAPGIFHVLRAARFAAAMGQLMDEFGDKMKPEVVWNVEQGMKLTAARIGRERRARGRLFQGVAAFFKTYDLLLCPSAIVAPFDVELRYVEEVEGHRFDNYIDWIAITYAISLTSCPALSLPCGFTRDGLPVGLQMVGRPRGEAALLSAAALAEEMFAIAQMVPVDPSKFTGPATAGVSTL